MGKLWHGFSRHYIFVCTIFFCIMAWEGKNQMISKGNPPKTLLNIEKENKTYLANMTNMNFGWHEKDFYWDEATNTVKVNHH